MTNMYEYMTVSHFLHTLRKLHLCEKGILASTVTDFLERQNGKKTQQTNS